MTVFFPEVFDFHILNPATLQAFAAYLHNDDDINPDTAETS